ncbi:hypothetical protein IB221_04280 [Pantoea sp. PNT01]|uniref:hypothetical protein n=1 Tax=Pantoea sp. PNT01 TaxID=2769271 RepID=UPI0017831E40|nr:hypothetical protein [Pantoea sp. PNT01]MBD9551485.1 hypothetical protein [Pantoea sp. PNT01]
MLIGGIPARGESGEEAGHEHSAHKIYNASTLLLLISGRQWTNSVSGKTDAGFTAFCKSLNQQQILPGLIAIKVQGFTGASLENDGV